MSDDWCPENDGAYRAELAAIHKDNTESTLRAQAARIAELESTIKDLKLQDTEGTRLMLGAQKRMRQYQARAERAETEVVRLREAADKLASWFGKHWQDDHFSMVSTYDAEAISRAFLAYQKATRQARAALQEKHQ